jgi:hypothetical protein
VRSGDNAVVAVDQHRVGPAVFFDARGQLRALFVAVRPGVPSIRNQIGDWSVNYLNFPTVSQDLTLCDFFAILRKEVPRGLRLLFTLDCYTPYDTACGRGILSPNTPAPGITPPTCASRRVIGRFAAGGVSRRDSSRLPEVSCL